MFIPDARFQKCQSWTMESIWLNWEMSTLQATREDKPDNGKLFHLARKKAEGAFNKWNNLFENIVVPTR